VRHFLRGVPVDESTLAFDVIKAVGPGGNFLEQLQTVERFRQEHYMSEMLGRDYPLEWPAAEEDDFLDQARDGVQQALATHHPAELDAGVKQEIQAILSRIGGERVIFRG
jgi:trimethylamine--corrinoid protein Co-methyltransferase